MPKRPVCPPDRIESSGHRRCRRSPVVRWNDRRRRGRLLHGLQIVDGGRVATPFKLVRPSLTSGPGDDEAPISAASRRTSQLAGMTLRQGVTRTLAKGRPCHRDRPRQAIGPGAIGKIDDEEAADHALAGIIQQRARRDDLARYSPSEILMRRAGGSTKLLMGGSYRDNSMANSMLAPLLRKGELRGVRVKRGSSRRERFVIA